MSRAQRRSHLEQPLQEQPPRGAEPLAVALQIIRAAPTRLRSGLRGNPHALRKSVPVVPIRIMRQRTRAAEIRVYRDNPNAAAFRNVGADPCVCPSG